MTRNDHVSGDGDGPVDLPDLYTIHVGAVLGPDWTDWFAGAEILARADGSGVLIAAIRDQAMLFGILLRIRDLGIPLLGVYPGCEWPLPTADQGPSGPDEASSITTVKGNGDV